MEISNFINVLTEKFYNFAPKLVSGLAVLLIGLYVASVFANQMRKTLLKSQIDNELSLFLSKIFRITLQITVIISSLSILGVKTSSFLAILGSAGLAVGLALQGSLSNLAGGVLILTLKPFRLEDLIEFSGHIGTVESIDIFTTKIKTPDNRLIIIPNGPLANGVVTNYSAQSTRRNEWIFSIGYNDNIEKAKAIILDYIEKNPKIHSDPAPFIAVNELADNSVNIIVRAWSNKADFRPVYHEILEQIKEAFDEAKITIPFPQRDVHLYSATQEIQN